MASHVYAHPAGGPSSESSLRAPHSASSAHVLNPAREFARALQIAALADPPGASSGPNADLVRSSSPGGLANLRTSSASDHPAARHPSLSDYADPDQPSHLNAEPASSASDSDEPGDPQSSGPSEHAAVGDREAIRRALAGGPITAGLWAQMVRISHAGAQPSATLKHAAETRSQPTPSSASGPFGSFRLAPTQSQVGPQAGASATPSHDPQLTPTGTRNPGTPFAAIGAMPSAGEAHAVLGEAGRPGPQPTSVAFPSGADPHHAAASTQAPHLPVAPNPTSLVGLTAAQSASQDLDARFASQRELPLEHASAAPRRPERSRAAPRSETRTERELSARGNSSTNTRISSAANDRPDAESRTTSAAIESLALQPGDLAQTPNPDYPLHGQDAPRHLSSDHADNLTEPDGQVWIEGARSAETAGSQADPSSPAIGQASVELAADHLGDGLAGVVERMNITGERGMVIVLRPAELGRIDVRIHESDHGVDVAFVASAESARWLLESDARHLRAALEDRGLRVARVHVSLRDDRTDAVNAARGDTEESGNADEPEARPGESPSAAEAADPQPPGLTHPLSLGQRGTPGADSSRGDRGSHASNVETVLLAYRARMAESHHLSHPASATGTDAARFPGPVRRGITSLA